jgi:hypothetical protein
MADIIDIKSRKPRPPGPPDLKAALYGMGYPLRRANCFCVALRELLLRSPDHIDDFVEEAKLPLICEIFEQIGEIELLWKEAQEASGILAA